MEQSEEKPKKRRKKKEGEAGKEHKTGEYMPVSRAMQIISGNLSQHINVIRLGLAFKAQGYEFRRTKHSRGYIVMQRDAGQIKERLRMLAMDDERDSGP